MPQRIYNGPFPEVEVVLPDGGTKLAVHGEVIEVPEQLAASLDQQGDTWLNPHVTQPTDLVAMKRADLNARAIELGIEDPSSLPSKAAVIEAISAAQATSDQVDARTAEDHQSAGEASQGTTASGGKE